MYHRLIDTGAKWLILIFLYCILLFKSTMKIIDVHPPPSIALVCIYMYVKAEEFLGIRKLSCIVYKVSYCKIPQANSQYGQICFLLAFPIYLKYVMNNTVGIKWAEHSTLLYNRHPINPEREVTQEGIVLWIMHAVGYCWSWTWTAAHSRFYLITCYKLHIAHYNQPHIQCWWSVIRELISVWLQ